MVLQWTLDLTMIPRLPRLTELKNLDFYTLNPAEVLIVPMVSFNQCRNLDEYRPPLAAEISLIDFNALDDALKPII